jgi:hypothetical protein
MDREMDMGFWLEKAEAGRGPTPRELTLRLVEPLH